jgi:hypothetical protein
MNYYVFIDDNNGHFQEYFNFKSNATKEQILDITESMKKCNGAYGRCGSKVHNLYEELTKNGFDFKIENNPRDRLYIDRTRIWCISGNY